MKLGVHSETGKPQSDGIAPSRTTGNRHDLLFDDVIWCRRRGPR
jgi:hypothetical protein